TMTPFVQLIYRNYGTLPKNMKKQLKYGTISIVLSFCCVSVAEVLFSFRHTALIELRSTLIPKFLFLKQCYFSSQRL
ncbi:MAG TPA: hypothetical protein PK491_03825, partial [Candidatus Hydrogenedentes bacterium]|nr:hypothetical protein [Candidatus Hydrogenedentota bacterium]